MPWTRVWESASQNPYQYQILLGAIDRIRKSGAEVFEDVDFPSAEDIIPPVGWDW